MGINKPKQHLNLKSIRFEFSTKQICENTYENYFEKLKNSKIPDRKLLLYQKCLKEFAKCQDKLDVSLFVAFVFTSIP